MMSRPGGPYESIYDGRLTDSAGSVSGGSTRFDLSRGAAGGTAAARASRRDVRGSSSTAKPGTVGRELEQHAARLLEIDRLEPEAVDHRRRLRAAGASTCARTVELVRVVVDAPGEMVDAADAPAAAPLRRRLADVDDTRGVAKAVARPAAFRRRAARNRAPAAESSPSRDASRSQTRAP